MFWCWFGLYVLSAFMDDDATARKIIGAAAVIITAALLINALRGYWRDGASGHGVPVSRPERGQEAADQDGVSLPPSAH